MNPRINCPRITGSESVTAVIGIVRWSPGKSVWYLGHLAVSLVGGWLFFSPSALAVFFTTTTVTLCLGHSLGMHRRLIHNSYDCPLWIEYVFVYLGVLVGMAGPFGMMYQHDLRDWAQRKTACHSYLRHGEGIVRDGWWQLNCDLRLESPPDFEPEERVRQDRFYRFLERSWMQQQFPWALAFLILGGIPWVVWGISVRIAVSITGHWLVGHFAHKRGPRDWHIRGAAAQGHNVRFAGLLSMGESWHNNHHAFPGSARLGLYRGQLDPGWWVLVCLRRLGLIWNVKLPPDLSYRVELEPISYARTKRVAESDNPAPLRLPAAIQPRLAPRDHPPGYTQRRL